MVEIGDVCFYSNGSSYVITENGPNIWATCFLCGAAVACTPDTKLADAVCGRCLAVNYELLPGQRIYEMKAEYARAHRPPRGKYRSH